MAKAKKQSARRDIQPKHKGAGAKASAASNLDAAHQPPGSFPPQTQPTGTSHECATSLSPAASALPPASGGAANNLGTGASFNIHTPISPRDIMLAYQKKWSDDKARWKFGLMSRQVGKDFSSGEEGVADCYSYDLKKEKTDWLIAAPSERQSLESLEKWKEWAEAYRLAIDDYQEEREKGSESLLKSATITFRHGSRVIAVPGKPDTVRGYSANILLTEFAFFENPDLTWRAILPSITNPLRGGVKKVRLITTPNGKGNKAHDIWTKNHGVKDAKWSTHLVTIYDAVKQGLPVDIEELKAAIDDPDGWAQEFECQFLDTQAVLLSYEVIALCESLEAHEHIGFDYWTSASQFPVDIGIDFGRKRDLTVCWAAEKVADLQITREVLTLEKMSTPDQVEALRPRIRKARRVCLDYTGPGVGLGDYLVKEFGEWDPKANKFGKIELITMGNTNKVEICTKLAHAMQGRKWLIPISRVIREDLHSVNKISTASGGITFRAPHTPDGHADRFTALALCNRAGSFAGGPFQFAVVPRITMGEFQSRGVNIRRVLL
jgi:phage FluMu gp28-like protein